MKFSFDEISDHASAFALLHAWPWRSCAAFVSLPTVSCFTCSPCPANPHTLKGFLSQAGRVFAHSCRVPPCVAGVLPQDETILHMANATNLFEGIQDFGLRLNRKNLLVFVASCQNLSQTGARETHCRVLRYECARPHANPAQF